MVFHKRRKPNMAPEQSRRQSQLVQSAWRHFGGAGPVIAFLNTRHDALEAQPLHLAIESDEGLRARGNLARANDAAGMMIFTEKTDENETKEDRRDRMGRRARDWSARTSEEDKALDAAVRRSIEVHGP